MTDVDMATRLVFAKLYFEKTAKNAEDFLKRCIKYFPFKIKSIQTDNGTEFTYRCHNFKTEHPLDKLCKKEKIERVYSPVANPWFNGVVEAVHGRYQKEFYDYEDEILTIF